MNDCFLIAPYSFYIGNDVHFTDDVHFTQHMESHSHIPPAPPALQPGTSTDLTARFQPLDSPSFALFSPPSYIF